MWNSLTNGVGMFAAKQKMFGGGEQVDTEKSNKMRKELAEKRKGRDEDSAARTADRKANKGKLSQMWAENKAKNQS